MIIYEDLSKTLIPNTAMRKIIIDRAHKGYSIQPLNGFKLHDNAIDVDIIDEATLEVTGKQFGYSPSSVDVTCGASYDFTAHTVMDENGNTFVAYGNRDFFAVPEREV